MKTNDPLEVSNIRPITKNALSLFLYKNINLKVIINNQDDLDTVCKYLDYDLENYLDDYMGPLWSPGSPIIVRLGNDGVSISGDAQRDIFGQSWDIISAISVEVFMNPGKYPQYFI